MAIPAAKASAAQSKGCRPSPASESRPELACEVTTDHVGTAALGCSVERSSTGFCANDRERRSAGLPRTCPERCEAVPTWPVLADEVEDAFQVVGLGK